MIDLTRLVTFIEQSAKEKYGNISKMIIASNGVLKKSVIDNMKREKPSIPNIVIFHKISELLEVSPNYLYDLIFDSSVTPPKGVVINKNKEENEKMSEKENFNSRLAEEIIEEWHNIVKKIYEEYGEYYLFRATECIEQSKKFRYVNITLKKLIGFVYDKQCPTWDEFVEMQRIISRNINESQEQRFDEFEKHLYKCQIFSERETDKLDRLEQKIDSIENQLTKHIREHAATKPNKGKERPTA